MSQSDVAEAMGTSQSAIARMESARENMTLDTVERFVVALDGRFHVSIPPSEHSPQPKRPWWELAESSDWACVVWATNQTRRTDQLIIGFQRSRKEYLTPPAGTRVSVPAMLLTSSTNSSEEA